MSLMTENRATLANARTGPQSHDAENRLRAVDRRTASDHPLANELWSYFFEEYRYDPLGRRVLVRSRNVCEGAFEQDPQTAFQCEASFIRRTVWDGSAELYEIQMPGDAGVSVATLENDTAFVTVGPTMVWPDIDRNALYGRVSYLYGTGIDQPLGAKRLKCAEKVSGVVTAFPAFGWAPHWNVRGQADGGSAQDGGRSPCINASTCLQQYNWPASYSPRAQQYRVRGGWQGTLLEDKRDMSGALFRRERYVDPASGRFTQEDPIGIAGGLNLSGFADGDPVNYSDPFGLCPPWNQETWDCGSTYYADRIARGKGWWLFNQLGGIITTCVETQGCIMRVLGLAGAGAAARGGGIGLTTKRLGSRLTVNQMNQQALRGQAPRGITRVDRGRTFGEQDNVHFGEKSALHRDGSWKHGGQPLTRAQEEWLVRNGWKLPR
jgi:RHS repeat-associated protein